MKKSILYAKITVSQKKIVSKLSFKFYIGFYFHSYNNVTNTHLNQLVKIVTQSLVGTSMLRIIMLWLEMHSGCGISMGNPSKANYTTV